jgi:ABC-type multidrug transport system fused ATPase/permease subunit
MSGVDGNIALSVAALFLGIVALFLTAFWIWMLVDCAVNEPSSTEKIVWVLVILFAHGIGALIYFFARRPTRIRETGR